MATFNDITKKIEEAIDKFNRGIPGVQKDVLDGITEELRKLDLKDGKIKSTVANLRLISRIKNKLQQLILTEDYITEVKDFAKTFNEITVLQNEYWKSVEKTFKPKTLLKEIKKQSIEDTVNKLTEAGIGVSIENQVSDILRQNITSGGSYKSLEAQLRELLTNTKKSDGALLKYTKTITTTSINQYSAQYTQIVSNDLGFEFYGYQGSDIKTTRPWCDAMTDRRYFHISEIPALLRAEGLTYENKKTGNRERVPIYEKTGLPHGMIDGTNAENIFVRRGGWNCGHQIRPVSESIVKSQAPALYNEIINSSAYKSWKRSRR